MRMCPPPSSAVSEVADHLRLAEDDLAQLGLEAREHVAWLGREGDERHGRAGEVRRCYASPPGAVKPRAPAGPLESRPDMSALPARISSAASPARPEPAWPRVPAGAHRRTHGIDRGRVSTRGHRVRDGFLPRPQTWRDVSVAVLGGGVSGLSAAWALDRGGPWRLRPSGAGGRGRWHRAIGSGRGHALSLGRPLRARPLPGEPPARRPPRRGGSDRRERRAGPSRLRRGRPLPRSAGAGVLPRRVVRGPLSPRGGDPARSRGAARVRGGDAAVVAAGATTRAGALSTSRGRAAPMRTEVRALDRLSMAAYLDGHGWRSARLRWLVEYGCRDDFGTTLAQTSAWAGVHYFAVPARRERAGGRPADLAGGQWAPRGARWRARAGARLETGAIVTDVRPHDHGVEVVWHDAGHGPDARAARAPCRVRAPPLPRRPRDRALSRGAAAHLTATTYGSWMVANLRLRDRPASRGFPLAWDNVLYDSRVARLRGGHAPDRAATTGPTVLTYYLPILDEDPAAGRRRLLATSWERVGGGHPLGSLARPSRTARPGRERRRVPLGARDGAAAPRASSGARPWPPRRGRSDGCGSRTPTCRAWRSSRRRSTGACAPPPTSSARRDGACRRSWRERRHRAGPRRGRRRHRARTLARVRVLGRRRLRRLGAPRVRPPRLGQPERHPRRRDAAVGLGRDRARRGRGPRVVHGLPRLPRPRRAAAETGPLPGCARRGLRGGRRPVRRRPPGSSGASSPTSPSSISCGSSMAGSRSIAGASAIPLPSTASSTTPPSTARPCTRSCGGTHICRASSSGSSRATSFRDFP